MAQSFLPSASTKLRPNDLLQTSTLLSAAKYLRRVHIDQPRTNYSGARVIPIILQNWRYQDPFYTTLLYLPHHQSKEV